MADPILSFLSNSNSNNLKKMNTQNNLSDTMLDKIQGLSIQLGEVYAQLYRDNQVSSETIDYALEAYKNTRRLLPTTLNKDGDVRHVGHYSAYGSTNGDTIESRVSNRKNLSLASSLPSDNMNMMG